MRTCGQKSDARRWHLRFKQGRLFQEAGWARAADTSFCIARNQEIPVDSRPPMTPCHKRVGYGSIQTVSIAILDTN